MKSKVVVFICSFRTCIHDKREKKRWEVETWASYVDWLWMINKNNNGIVIMKIDKATRGSYLFHWFIQDETLTYWQSLIFICWRENEKLRIIKGQPWLSTKNSPRTKLNKLLKTCLWYHPPLNLHIALSKMLKSNTSIQKKTVSFKLSILLLWQNFITI